MSKAKDVRNALRDAFSELEARVMPDGMEWPRFEDGEPVRLGDEFECWCGETHAVASVTIREGRSVLNASQPHTFVVSNGPFTAHGERVKRPAVLAADGEPLEAGQTVFMVGNGRRGSVMGFDGVLAIVEYETTDVNGGTMAVRTEGACLTHQRPVLDADGVLIKEGDPVWHIETGREYVVIEPSYGEAVVVRLAKYDDAEGEQYAPDKLSHTKPEPPDSWERIEQDARAMLDDGLHPNDEWVLDLLSRAKALAEREQR
ncbi:MAG TPA: hypothetical protein IAC12_03735 [Candidatus Aphodovivens avistercoris]|nr:hypothetical protein [Candidatus Aphodovivens avistercoris]